MVAGCSLSNDDQNPIKSLTSNAFKDTSPVRQYETVSFDSQLVAEWQDPYASNDVAVDLQIVTPSNKTLKLPGYYVEGDSNTLSSWKFKLAPKEIGSYTVSVILTDDGKITGESPASNFSVEPSDANGFIESNDNWTFKYSNGELFRGIGENFGWEARDTDDSRYFKELHEQKRFNYDQVLKKLNEQGANIIRTWMIYWNLPVDWKTVKNASRYSDDAQRFNRSGIERMDDLVSLATQYDIKIILSMDSHAGFDSNGWALNSYNQENGGPAASVEDFFVNPKAKQRYKDKLRFLVAKWSHSPSIAAWEFFNEIDNAMYHGEEQHIADEIITEWHTEMSAYLKSIDPHQHLITTSISHRGVKGLFDIKHIDLNQSHLYKVTDRIPEIINKFVKHHNKPYFAGEFSAEWDWSKNFDDFKELMISDFKRGLWYGIFSPTPIMPLSWWWEYFDENGTTNYFNNVKKINELMLTGGNGYIREQSLNNPNVSLKTLAVTNGKNIFAYVYNATDIQQKFTLTGHQSVAKPSAIYDCESGQYIDINNGTYLTIEAGQDLIYIFDL